ncbi:MAG TPA: PSD1 and planctomycete cytochrome C domain-containing protein [Planctomycetaceae bacterium]
MVRACSSRRAATSQSIADPPAQPHQRAARPPLPPLAKGGKRHCFARVLAIVALLLSCRLQTAPAADERPARDEVFESKILPLLKARCGACHGDGENKSGIKVLTILDLLAGGATRGAAIVPGHPELSVLVKLISGQAKPRMPLKGEPLSADEISLVESWIKQLKAPASANSDDARSWWAVQKIENVLPPEVKNAGRVRNPIDRFVLAGLERAGIAPAPAASKAVLLRRAFFDLVGMPPTLAETKRFLDDDSPDASEQLIDRLLADQRYGERWGRHWLDVVRYADSGGSEYDREYSHLWRYRDYVIRSFNEDKLYDRFVIEQMAGDEIDAPTMQSRTALGFLRLSPEHGSPNKDINRQLLLNDVAAAVGSVFLGVTLGCAQCHDHKYDPITQRDFYRVQAFFVGMRLEQVDLPFDGADVERFAAGRKAAEEHLAQLQQRAAALEGEYLARLKELLVSEGVSPEEAAKQVTRADLDKRLAQAESAGGSLATPGKPSPFTAAERLALTRLRNDLAEATLDGTFEKGAARRRVDRFLPKAHVVTNTTQDYFAVAPHLPVAFVRIRGDVDRLGEMVRPGFLSAVTGNHDPAPSRTDKFGNLEKFRIGLAEWIAGPENPLTSRVMVNRIWQYHFGQGLVRTANNFGRNGAAPTHPELLDWLAGQFIANKCSIKSLHRLIMQSATYRQSSAVEISDLGIGISDLKRTNSNVGVPRSQFVNPKSEIPASKMTGPKSRLSVDPQNKLLWRMNRRRLEGEVIRDSILAVSGRLNLEMGGPAIYPPLPEGMEDRTYYKHSRFWEPTDGPESRRRSVYIFNRRQLDFPLLAALDAPVFSSPNEQRAVSTTPLQALLLLNGRLVNEEAAHFARRVTELAGPDPEAQIRVAYELALTRPPNRDEIHVFREFLASDSDGKSAGQALVGLCRVLFNLNEFIYVD